jgi:hypothetical protein
MKPKEMKPDAKNTPPEKLTPSQFNDKINPERWTAIIRDANSFKNKLPRSANFSPDEPGILRTHETPEDRAAMIKRLKNKMEKQTAETKKESERFIVPSTEEEAKNLAQQLSDQSSIDLDNRDLAAAKDKLEKLKQIETAFPGTATRDISLVKDDISDYF